MRQRDRDAMIAIVIIGMILFVAYLLLSSLP
jgi:hypothetical protein